MEHTGFPSDETLAAFLDGRLDPDTRRRVIEHMTTCNECYALVVVDKPPQTAVVLASGGGGGNAGSLVLSKRRLEQRHTIGVRRALAVAATLAIVILSVFVSQSLSRDQTQKLAAVAPPERSMEGRLADFPHRPLSAVMRGKKEDAAFDDNPANWAFANAAAKVAAKAIKEPNADNLHALGVSQLFHGKPDDAVRTLDLALRNQTKQKDIRIAISQSRNDRLLNDLSVALCARGDFRAQPQDYADAFEFADAAFKKHKTPAAAWNRALALEKLHADTTVAAWRLYRELETDAAWTAEADTRHMPPQNDNAWNHLSALIAGGSASEADIDLAAKQYAGEALTWAEETQLAAWANATLSKDSRLADNYFSGLKRLAVSISRLDGDDLLLDELSIISRAQGPDLRRIALGHALYAHGRALYHADDIGGARTALVNAGKQFSLASAPFRALTILGVASCDYLTGSYDAVTRAAEPIACTALKYPSLRSRAHWLTGIARLEMGQPREALAHYKDAATLSESVGERDHIVAAQVLMAQVSDYLGRTSDAWTYRAAALQNATRVDTSSWARRASIETAVAAWRSNRLSLAANLLDGLVARGRRSGDAIATVAALRWRALLRFKTGDRLGSFSDLNTAREQLRHIGDVSLRTDVASAIEVASAIIGDVRSVRDASGVAQLPQQSLFRRVEAEVERHTSDGAPNLSELLPTIAAIEERFKDIHSDDGVARPFVRDSLGVLYDSAITAAVADGQHPLAFRLTEQARRSALRRNGFGVNITPPTVDDVRQSLSEGVAVVDYAFIGKDLYTWVLTTQSLNFHRLSGRAAEIGALSDEFTRVIAVDDRPALLELAASLYEALLRPLYPDLRGIGELRIVADGALVKVPFAALFDRVGNEFAGQRFAFTNAPVVSCGALVDRRAALRAIALINPDASRQGYARLPGAEQESRDLAALRPTVVTGRQATVSVFIAALRDAGWIHFAGHAEANGAEPDYSSLVLFDDGKGWGSRLSARQIRSASLRPGAVVVLAACGTGSKASGHFDGSWSLADAFVRAGAAVVISSIAPLYDEATPEFVKHLYAGVDRGVPLPQCVQQAQIAMIHAQRPVRSWCSFVMTS